MRGWGVVVARWGDVRREGSVSRPVAGLGKPKPKPKPKPKKKKSSGVVVLSGFRNRASLGRLSVTSTPSKVCKV